MLACSLRVSARDRGGHDDDRCVRRHGPLGSPWSKGVPGPVQDLRARFTSSPATGTRRSHPRPHRREAAHPVSPFAVRTQDAILWLTVPPRFLQARSRLRPGGPHVIVGRRLAMSPPSLLPSGTGASRIATYTRVRSCRDVVTMTSLFATSGRRCRFLHATSSDRQPSHCHSLVSAVVRYWTRRLTVHLGQLRRVG